LVNNILLQIGQRKINQKNKSEMLLNENLLIDFEEKRIENRNNRQIEIKPKRKTKFDIGPIEPIDFKKDEEEKNNFDYNTSFVDLNERLKVKQSYDKKLTEVEKDNLEKVIAEEKDFKEKMNYMKRKKELDRLERLERIKSISFPKE